MTLNPENKVRVKEPLSGNPRIAKVEMLGTSDVSRLAVRSLVGSDTAEKPYYYTNLPQEPTVAWAVNHDTTPIAEHVQSINIDASTAFGAAVAEVARIAAERRSR